MSARSLAARLPACCEKRFPPDEGHLVAAARPDVAIGPHFIPCHSADRAHEMNLHRRDAHLEHPARVSEVSRLQLPDGEPEGADVEVAGDRGAP